MSKLPLTGIRVIDHGIVYTGTAATTLLADMGAEVIRVEPINILPPFTRGMMARPPKGIPMPGYVDSDPGERPWDRWFQLHAMQHNKYDITLDLSQPKGVEIYKRIAKISDVVLENFAPGVMDRMGIGYEDLKAVKPDIILISASGLGAVGPYKNYAAVGTSLSGMTGMMSLRGYPGDDPTIRTVMPVWSDNVAATTAAFAAIAALYMRRKTGKGQFIDMSQAETFLPHMGEVIVDYTMNGRVAQVMGNRDQTMAPQGCYPCRGEDQWVTLSISTDRQWEGLCRAMGNPPWTKEERFGSVLGRLSNQDDLDKNIGEWTKQQDHYEVMHLLQKEGVPAGPVLTCTEIFSDPHLEARGYFTELTHREAGTHRYPGNAFQFSKTPMSIRMAPPCLGEHNDYIYGELLGMTKAEIEALKAENLIGDAYLPEVF
ncbi:MAG: CoA transferase [Deltaproteobacteria bacterium]|nr:CoA transferase [Deltaproteobacteria bacterium]